MNLVSRITIGTTIASMIFAGAAIAQAPPSAGGAANGQNPPATAGARRVPPAPSLLVLSSPAFTDGATLPDKYAQLSQKNPAISPPFSWTGAPEGTQSFVMLMRDEEYAPGKNFAPYYHWIIFNIPATTTSLPEGVPAEKHLADGTVQPQTARGVGYIGPGAPANGQPHHYTYSLFALDTKLDLGPDATIADVSKAMDGHILDKGFLVSRYHRTAQ
jgi:Raf kinase inhibitor-like YbhB/YbcL family protein